MGLEGPGMASAKRQNKTQREAERRAVRRDVVKRGLGLLFKHSRYYTRIYTGVPIGDAALARLSGNGVPEDTPLFEERSVTDGSLGGSCFNERAGSR